MGRQIGRSRGCAILGWAIFFLLLVVLVLFGYRTFFYYRELRAGNIVELPSNSSRITLDSEPAANSLSRVAPNEVDAGDQPFLGAAKEEATVTVVMFGDFECPFSREAATVFRRLAVLYGEQARFVYRDFPLQSIHVNAYQAALAAECAREQRRYWEYFDRLYATAADLAPASLNRYAQEIGLDMMQFENCLSSGRYDIRVTEDLATVELLGLPGTPIFYINGRKVEGAISEDDFERTIKKLLK